MIFVVWRKTRSRLSIVRHRARRGGAKHILDLLDDLDDAGRRLDRHAISKGRREASNVVVVHLVPHRQDYLAVRSADLARDQSVKFSPRPLLAEEARTQYHQSVLSFAETPVNLGTQAVAET